MNNNKSKNNLTTKTIAFLTILLLLLNLIIPSAMAEEIPTIKLGINDTFTINPYEYVTRDYKNKELNFNITKANVSEMALVQNTKNIVFTGKQAGDTVFTISSEGRELYKININVNPNNRIETTNLNPIENNASNKDNNIDPNSHIIKLNINGIYNINPYNYITKDYKNKELNFNMSNVNVANMNLDNATKIVTVKGLSNGTSELTISSEGKELYKIIVDVNERNSIETINLEPIANNAASNDEDTSENINPNIPTIKLNVNGNYTIKPYDYVPKEYLTNGKKIHFNISNSNIAKMNLNRETKEITFTGVSKGSSVFTVSSEGNELYKIDIKVNDKYTPEAINLNPTNNNTSDNNKQDNNNTPSPKPNTDNNNNSGNGNTQPQPQPQPEPKPNTDINTNPNNEQSNLPTINLNINGNYTIDPYDYITKDYKYKQLDFNIANTSIATIAKDNNNKIKFLGKGSGNTTFTISSNGKELYKININVNENNNNSTSNLAPVANNANTPDNNNNNNQNNTDPNVTKDMPTIKLNVNKDYTINPYNYITKDYKYKPLHFNIANTSVATSTLDKQTKLIKFTGVGNGNTIFTISSEGKDLYKINVIVDDKNIVGTSNLDPISNNANTPDNANNNNSNNNNNNSNIGKPNIEPTPIKPVPDNNNSNNSNSSSNNSGSTTNYDKYIPTTNTDRYVPNSSNNNNNNNNVSGPIIGSNDRETTTTPNPPTSDPLAETGYYTPKGETPDKPNNVDISKNPNTKPVNPTPKPNTVKPNIIPKSGLDYTIYGAIVLAIGFVTFTANKYFKYNKMVKDQKSVK